MPWKDGYTITDEIGLRDEEVAWPENFQCAVILIVDYSVQGGNDGIASKDLTKPQAIFGAKVGVERIFVLFERYGLKATFAVPAIMAEIYPEMVREMIERGHEVAAHGYLHEDVSGLEVHEEKRRLDLTTHILTETCGKKPEGWFSLPRQQDRYPGGQISPNTIQLLIEAGYEYLGNAMADDIPHYWVVDIYTKRHILTLPYYYHFDDLFFLMFPTLGMGSGLENAMTLFENWRQEFEATYRRGRCFTMVVHPHLIAWGNRIEMFEKFLLHIKGFPAIWNPTGSECARYWKERYPTSSFLNLEESIWKDYPGSLS